MNKIELWAPHAQELFIDLNGNRLPMQKQADDWWSIEHEAIQDGASYSFYINQRGPFPDPRSPWQPEGVHGPSKWLNHSQFSWHDEGWQPSPISSALFYELHVGTFTAEGTFEAIIDYLDYLVDLGVTHIELMPIADFPGKRGWGYDGVSLYAPSHNYGGPEGLKKFMDACHAKGLAVVLDVVYNHLGPDGNYLSQFGPYFTKRHSTPWGDAVNLDGSHSNEVRRFFINNALMWLRDYHFDGLRIDAVHAIMDLSAFHFLEELVSDVRKLEIKVNKKLLVIVESDLNDPRMVVLQQLGGYGADAQWNEDFHHSLHALLTREHSGYFMDFRSLSDLAKALSKGVVFDGCYSVYRQRCHGRSYEGIVPHQLIGFIQNHDQIGNRAFGERTSHLLTLDQLKIAAALLFFAPFIPMIFQGEEWGASSPFLYFTDHHATGLGDAIYNGRKNEFKDFYNGDNLPHPQAEENFLKSKLNWNELEHYPHAELFEWYKALITLRKTFPDWRENSYGNVIFNEERQWLAMKRGKFLMICNFNEQSLVFSFPGQIVLSSHSQLNELPSFSVAIIEVPIDYSLDLILANLDSIGNLFV